MKLSVLVCAVLALLLLAGNVAAIHDSYYYETIYGGYGGQSARDRRAAEPYSREQYFGYGYNAPFVNYGSKGPTYRMTNTGRKSMYDSKFNLDTNSFRPRGRDPSFISNWDPNFRGYPTIDQYAYLLPYTPTAALIGPNVLGPRATARIVSLGNAYGGVQNKGVPSTQVYLHTQNLEPLGPDQVYEAWLFDSKNEYSLNLGILKSNNRLTSSLTTEGLFVIQKKATPFDAVLITKEPFPDLDPGPGEIVLFGQIPPSRTVLNPNPAYTQQRLR